MSQQSQLQNKCCSLNLLCTDVMANHINDPSSYQSTLLVHPATAHENMIFWVVTHLSSKQNCILLTVLQVLDSDTLSLKRLMSCEKVQLASDYCYNTMIVHKADDWWSFSTHQKTHITTELWQTTQIYILMMRWVSYRMLLYEEEPLCRDELAPSSAVSAHRKKPQRESCGRGHE